MRETEGLRVLHWRHHISFLSHSFSWHMSLAPNYLWLPYPCLIKSTLPKQLVLICKNKPSFQEPSPINYSGYYLNFPRSLLLKFYKRSPLLPKIKRSSSNQYLTTQAYTADALADFLLLEERDQRELRSQVSGES